MSFEIGQKVLNLEVTPRVGHTEYCDNDRLVKHVTGISLREKDGRARMEAMGKFLEWAECDLMFNTCDGAPWESLGRVTEMGHAVYAQDGSDFRKKGKHPFQTPAEVLSFNAIREYGSPDIAKNFSFFKTRHRQLQESFPNLVVPGGYYKTLISGCIAAFGWEMFLLALGEDGEKFGECVLEGFCDYTRAQMEAWSLVGIKVFIFHDDFVWAGGPFADPSWYRRHVIPRYAKLWGGMKRRGIKVLFCSDGDFTEFIDDIAEAGADGFIFEPLADFEKIVSRYGKTHVIIGNVDCRILTRGGKKDIEKEVRRCIEPGLECPGFMIAVGNHIPPEVPVENALYYFELVRKLGRR